MMGDKYKVLLSAVLFSIFVLIAGCQESSAIHLPAQDLDSAATPPPVSFSPQAAMQTGDYASFYAENLETIKPCRDPDKCLAALFNLSFLYCYPKSPYYDPRQGIKYVDDMMAAAPSHPWTFQAMAWKALIEKNLKKKTSKRPAKGEQLKGKESPESPEDEMAQLPANSRETGTDWEVDRQRLEDEISSKEEIIKELNRQIERSRQIDIEMEKKERGLRQH
jgi:hypothetical protein